MEKMCNYLQILLFCVISLVVGSNCTDTENSVPEGNSENGIMERPNSWLQKAKDMFVTPAGHMLMQVAKELLNRSAGNSQVLSLNLTNLSIIVLLKILIFVAGMLGASHWSSYGYGRSSDSNNLAVTPLGFEESEAYLITGFLAAQGSGTHECLYAAACNNPSMAYEYARAAEALMIGIEKFEGEPLNNPHYKELIVLMERAAYDGYCGKPCNTTEKCDGLW